ncbi:rev-1, partial [Pristionchus pacificus]|uniref:DNA repair protein REV1 n=1 Tax=Pristionchus pacificus TaxID=54126 RepID=A0A8R1Z674_PRIPA
ILNQMEGVLDGEMKLYADEDEPGPSNQIIPRVVSPELFTGDGELTRDDETTNTQWSAVVNSRDTVDAPMIIDSDEPGTSKPPVDFALMRRWLHEGAEQEENDGRRRGAAVGWMMEGRGDEKGQLRSFGHYMRLKKDKLQHQVNVLGRVKQVSEIFKGISIFVNGFTYPPALELRSLIQSHGGEYHVYYEYGTTTYTVASEIATVKRSKMRKNEVIVKPELIVDSVAAGRLLDHKEYLLLPDEDEMLRRKGGTISQAMKTLTEKAGEAETRGEKRQGAMDARDAAFIDEYYARSRLHLISTLAQEMRDYVSSLRDTNSSIETARAEMSERLKERSEEGANSRSLPPMERAIFHVDLDCFFVSVTLRNRPDLRGKPVAVTHSSGSKESNGFSEIASCSYEARAKGVKNGSLVRDALRKCCDLVCVPYQFDDYRSVSKMIFDVIASHTLQLRAVSCDEMYVDATSLIRSFDGYGSEGVVDSHSSIGPIVIANYLRGLIRERTGCPASVGIGPNPLVARLATRFAKPDGVKWVQKREVEEFIANQKVSDLPGVGYSTLNKLGEFGGADMKCGDMRKFEEKELEGVLGKKTAHLLYRMIRGRDDSEVVVERVRKSVSCDINYGIRFTKDEELQQFLSSLASQLEKKLLQARMKAGAITLKVMVRAADAPVETAKYLGHGRCDTHTRCGRLDPVCGDAEKLVNEARKLMATIKAPVEELRGIGIQLGRLVPSNSAARPLASQLNRFFGRKRNGGIIEGIEKMEKEKENEKEKEEEKEEGMKRPRLEQNEDGIDDMEDHRKPMRDYMANDELPARYHTAVSDLRILPLPSTEKLSFMGESNGSNMKTKIIEMMTEDPSPPLYGSLLFHGWALIQRGELVSLRDFARAILLALNSPRIADGWMFTTRLICAEWEKMCSRRYLAVPDLLQREERSNWNETVEGAWQNEEEEEDSPDNDDTTLTTFPIM